MNIDTDLRLASTGAIRRFLAQHPNESTHVSIWKPQPDAMRDICMPRYEALARQGWQAKLEAVNLDLMANPYAKGELAQIVR